MGKAIRESWEKVPSENQQHALTMFIWVALNVNVKQAKMLWTIIEMCLNPKSPQEQQKSYSVQ